MRLTLGPVLFNWDAGAWRDFYFRMADEAPVDTVVVGEIVCSKRLPFFLDHMPSVIDRLTAAGKTVLLGSLVLVSLPRERRQMADLVEAEHLVEVNDLSCMPALAGRRHAIGPFVNVYNEATAAFLAGRGAERICLPPELPLASVRAIATALPDTVFEVFAFGKVPLAISARCYHARVHGLSKDNCRFICEQDPDGLPVSTLDGDGFLTVNGVQTLSHTCANLLGDAPALADAGVRSLRLSPQHCDMVEVARTFRDVLDGRSEAEAGSEALATLYPAVPFANGFLHGIPGASRVAGARAGGA
ncbi:ubiquinone anaerobic biosynthesis protein UbiV [Azorhizobium doebereinerae]|uniref:ubiquinone anaerobic biosynthesis protein UbiV n=1 Tax=Azorhizobium doebereinerae TaxID=281091 RepID=UPI0003F5255D|nr:U32 family peptidase [Azorhizobium doebereinerae]